MLLHKNVVGLKRLTVAPVPSPTLIKICFSLFVLKINKYH